MKERCTISDNKIMKKSSNSNTNHVGISKNMNSYVHIQKIIINENLTDCELRWRSQQKKKNRNEKTIKQKR